MPGDGEAEMEGEGESVTHILFFVSICTGLGSKV